MVPIALADELEITRMATPGVELGCDDPTLPRDASNLAFAAAERFLHETGSGGGAQIHLTKRVPHGAGLGGGSSDAAAVLLALDALDGGRTAREKLGEIALSLGSDIPFFLTPGAAICRGRGERLEPFHLPLPLDLLLIKPPFGVSTAWAYRAYAETPADVACPAQRVAGMDIRNDLEAPVFRKFLILPIIKDWLLAQPGVEAAQMSGSGSTLFAVLGAKADGPGILARFAAEFGPHYWTTLTRTHAGT